VLIDESLFNFPSILIGAGEVGVEIEIAPATLKEITAAITLAFARA
jgi:prolyl-tRNA editing enzyme YbaK/EbsC (Cys-tRNA(Pro) deacylase)